MVRGGRAGSLRIASDRWPPASVRIVVTSAMYLGDVAPFVAPANRLAERGHDVTFLAPVGVHEQLGGERFALAAYPLDRSARAMHADPEHQRLMRHPAGGSRR